jgi:hypothetical protein
MGPNNGIAMLLKAMGFDPQQLIAELQAKALEAEAAARAFGTNVQAQVTEINTRITNMESLLVLILSKQDQALDKVLPAGECSPELHEPQVLAAPQPQEESKQHVRRNTRDRSTLGQLRATG